MSHYKTNLRDIFFNIFEVNHVEDYLDDDLFEGFDADAVKDILYELDRLAREEFAASFTSADRNPPQLDAAGNVELSSELRHSLDAFYDGGWDRLGLPAGVGGTPVPASVYWSAAELLVGANPAAFFYTIGSLMAAILYEVGNDEQKALARMMVERRWGGTMVLTEPDAGSDVGAGLTRAIRLEGNTYHIEGVKRFITSGEHDYSDNIVHLVLARPEGAGPGTKGLSLFAVPKVMVNADGTLGERNGVLATKVEHKMGIRGSSTCELTFGQDQPCVGYLVGDVHQGIAQMFRVIENARMMIGIKAAATLSTGYLGALEYARERIQGPDLKAVVDKASPRVAIIRHPDVRRMLMLQKAHAEGLRALVMYTAWAQDQAMIHRDQPEWSRLCDLLLPMVKGYSSEKAYELLASSLQVLGGAGFTEDFPVEQYIRDAKIDTLYEGTTGIQALDLFFRKIVRDKGDTLSRLAAQVLEFVKAGGPDDPLAAERELLGAALEDVQAQLGHMVGTLMEAQQQPVEMYAVGLHTNSLLESTSEVLLGWRLLVHAGIALRKMMDCDDADRAFYEGKVASARFFARNVLPKTALRRRLAESEDGAIMQLADEVF